MGHRRPVSLLAENSAQFVGHRHGPMVSAGAAHGHVQMILSFLNVARHQILYQAHEILQEFLRDVKLQDVGRDLLVVSGELPKAL